MTDFMPTSAHTTVISETTALEDMIGVENLKDPALMERLSQQFNNGEYDQLLMNKFDDGTLTNEDFDPSNYAHKGYAETFTEVNPVEVDYDTEPNCLPSGMSYELCHYLIETGQYESLNPEDFAELQEPELDTRTAHERTNQIRMAQWGV